MRGSYTYVYFILTFCRSSASLYCSMTWHLFCLVGAKFLRWIIYWSRYYALALMQALCFFFQSRIASSTTLHTLTSAFARNTSLGYGAWFVLIRLIHRVVEYWLQKTWFLSEYNFCFSFNRVLNFELFFFSDSNLTLTSIIIINISWNWKICVQEVMGPLLIMCRDGNILKLDR